MKTKFLIIGSFIALIALVAIQGYLVHNTYELKKKTITIDARNAIRSVYNSNEIDSISWLYRYYFEDKLESYTRSEISKKQLTDSLDAYCKQINPGFVNTFKKGLEENNDGIGIKLQILAQSIFVTDSVGENDTLYDFAKDKKLLLLGEAYPLEEGIMINNSTWQNSYNFLIEKGYSIPLDLEFRTRVYMDITNWEVLIFNEMLTILLLSLVLLSFVVGLLYYSIQNLLKQKRIAEVKTDFINNITHELKTPLTTLSIGTKTLKSAHAQSEQELITESLEIIDRQNTRLQNLIDQVLKSSLGYSEIVLNKDEFNCTNFLNDLLNDYTLTLDEGIVLERHIENTGVLMQADTFFLGTAILNLLNNSIKYGGTLLDVSYKMAMEEGYHVIGIKDNGIGISSKYHKYIFDKFYRVSESYTHNYKGLGLGLYYTHQIIKAHKGSIRVKSKENQGAEFIIKIPVVV